MRSTGCWIHATLKNLPFWIDEQKEKGYVTILLLECFGANRQLRKQSCQIRRENKKTLSSSELNVFASTDDWLHCSTQGLLGSDCKEFVSIGDEDLVIRCDRCRIKRGA
jgi:hypothetical protein